MAFNSLSDKLQNIFKNLRGKGRLTEADVKTALKEVKMALLEADVNFKVVKQFIKSVEERAIGQDVMQSLTPGQMVIKIVNEEMVSLMGSETTEIALKSGNEITVIMMAGLQGAGKTTTTAKLAGKFKSKGRKPLLAACDIYRPAAIEQLRINGEKQGVEVFSMGTNNNPVDIAKAAIQHAKNNNFNVVILDTAGRLHVDEDMMAELQHIKQEIAVDQTILVVDSMTGQDAVNVAATFNEKIGIDGVILTKLDGDTRGGAALSIKAVTGKPILYVGMGEKLSDLEQFYPDRMANRILGMGDVLSLIEKAEAELESIKIEDEVSEEVCDVCGRNMVIKYGPHGKFLACPGFPECRFTKPFYEKIGVTCPKCGGDVVIKTTRKGRRYYGCINAPECDFMSWAMPSNEKCPECGKYMIVKGNKLVCSDQECGYTCNNKAAETADK